jgi:plasmid maintenance system antidote protein VapI
MSQEYISETLRRVVIERELTGGQLGRHTGLAPHRIRNFLSGKYDIRVETAESIAHVLGLILHGEFYGPVPDDATIGDVIARSMMERGLSAHAVGRMSGVARSIVKRFLNGQRSINLRSADRVAFALDLSLRENPAVPLTLGIRSDIFRLSANDTETRKADERRP